VRTNNPGKKTKANDTLAIIVFQAFVIDQG
jgi:hypothetical protein